MGQRQLLPWLDGARGRVRSELRYRQARDFEDSYRTPAGAKGRRFCGCSAKHSWAGRESAFTWVPLKSDRLQKPVLKCVARGEAPSGVSRLAELSVRGSEP